MSAIIPKIHVGTATEIYPPGPPEPRRTGAYTPQGARFPSDPEAGGLLEWSRIVWEGRKKVLCAMAAGLVLALAFGLLKRPTYSARAELAIENPNADFLDTQAISPIGQDPSAASGLTDVQTQLQVMLSDQMLDRVLAQLQRENKLGALEEESKQSSWIYQYLHLSPPTAADLSYRMHKVAAAHLTVRQVGPSRAVDVTYTSYDPAFAASFVNTFTSEYIAANTEARWALSERTGEGLMHRLTAVKEQLQESQNALQEYARQSGLLFGPPVPGTTEQSDVSETRLMQLQDEVSRAEADRVVAESHLKTAQSANPDTLADVLNDDRLRDLKAKLADLEREKADLQVIYTPKHEKVLRVEAQIAPLQSAFDAQRTMILDRISTDYLTASRREGMLKRTYAQQVAIVTQKNDKSIRYGILKGQVDSNQKLYDSILEQVNRVKIASAAGASNVQVFSGATVPVKPNSSGLPVDAALGMLFGFLGGSAYVLAAARANRTFSNPGQIGVTVQLRELGVIPSQTEKSKGITPAGKSVSSPRVLFQEANNDPSNEAERSSVELASWFAKTGQIAESFRMLLASTMCPDERRARPRVIVVTSANIEEGKTTIVSNLAIAMAEIGQRVLLIDADIRKPRLHRVFGVDNVRGLTDVADDRQKVSIQHTFVPRLDLLPAGVSASAALFYSPSLASFFKEMRGAYDTVLVDTAPCLHLADARVLGRLADSVMLVTRVGRTTWEEGRLVAQRFTQDGISVMGTVLNDFNKPLALYSYLSA